MSVCEMTSSRLQHWLF